MIRPKGQLRRDGDNVSCKKFGGRPPQVPDPEQAKPEPTAQRNFTDPESRIMLDGATKRILRGYNAQIAVDSHSPIIVAGALTQEATDKRQLAPMLAQVEQNLGRKPEHATADTGYFSEAAVTDPKVKGINLPVPPERQNLNELGQVGAVIATEVRRRTQARSVSCRIGVSIWLRFNLCRLKLSAKRMGDSWLRFQSCPE